MTREQAYKILIERGFGEDNFEYEYMNERGVYDGSFHNKVRVLGCMGDSIGNFLDCGPGYLWSTCNPDIVHKGTVTYLAKQKKASSFEELLSKINSL